METSGVWPFDVTPKVQNWIGAKYSKNTLTTMADEELPAGWEKRLSRSTGMSRWMIFATSNACSCCEPVNFSDLSSSHLSPVRIRVSRMAGIFRQHLVDLINYKRSNKFCRLSPSFFIRAYSQPYFILDGKERMVGVNFCQK